MADWTIYALMEMCGDEYTTATLPPLQPSGPGRIAFRWMCGGDDAAIEAIEDSAHTKLRVSCEHELHRELETYQDVLVGDIVLLNAKMDAVDALPANGKGYQLHLSVAGPPDLKQFLQLRLDVNSRRNQQVTPERINVGTYAGGGRQFYTPLISSDAEDELVLTLRAIPVQLFRVNQDAFGLVLWKGNIQVA
jgi:hypothetical protein